MKNKFSKSAAVIITLIMVFSTVTAPVLAASFSDLNGHWGYDFVMTLVNDGTVNGYPDGTFRPNGTVTRAEFVKLIGKSEELYTGRYNDIEGHWGYDYIMYSGLDGYSGSTFRPDEPITRNDCVNLIWKRNGSQKDIICPSVITNQGTNRDAVAWAYTNGIVCGDDGLNLRLSDTLTRAEAATLIVRSRNIDPNAPKVNFADKINPEILKVVFDSFDIFDGIEYNPDATITNGQLAKAVLSYGFGSNEPSYTGLGFRIEYDGQYAKEMFIVHDECMNDVPVTLDSENKNATVKHTLAEFMFNTMRRVGNMKNGNGKAYTDIGSYEGRQKLFIDYAYKNGILLNSSLNIEPDRVVTHKDIALILLQIDELYPTQLAYVDGKKVWMKINKNLGVYPANYHEYTSIIDGISQSVYSFKFDKNPKIFGDSISNLLSVLDNVLGAIGDKYQTDDIKMSFTCYSTLVSEENGGVVFIAKLDLENPNQLKMSEIFKDMYKVSYDAVVTDEAYLVFKTSSPIISFVFEPDELEIIDVIS